MAGVYAWIREGVRRAVLLGFSDAVEELGLPQEVDGINPELVGVLRQRALPNESLAPARVLPNAGGRKRLGKSLEQIAKTPEAAG